MMDDSIFGSATKALKGMLNISHNRNGSMTSNGDTGMDDLIQGLDMLSPNDRQATADDKASLCNNCALDLRTGDTVLKSLDLRTPAISSDDANHFTNSSFAKVTKLIDYKWEVLGSHLNIQAIHRSKPIVAYVINPAYCKMMNHGRPSVSTDFSNQKIRLFNYEYPLERCLCSTEFSDAIADMAFAYNSQLANSTAANKLVAVDRAGNVNVFAFREEEVEKLSLERILVITSLESTRFSEIRIDWCPFVSGQEPESINSEYGDVGMMIALSLDRTLEVFSIDKITSGQERSFSRSQLTLADHNYQSFPDQQNEPIIAVSLSNDSTAVCTASSGNSIKFYQVSKVEPSNMLHEWKPELALEDRISYFHFLDDYNYLLMNRDHNFWGYAIIGTASGSVSIWDLRKWKCIQTLRIRDDTSLTPFEYRVDISSQVVLAVRGDMAILLLLEFEEQAEKDTEEENDVDSDEESTVVLIPKITKVARFQLYNPLLSFVIKKQSDTRIDVFWITAKSLEMCTIDVSKLDEELTLVGSEPSPQPAIGLAISTKRPNPSTSSSNDGCSRRPIIDLGTPPKVTLVAREPEVPTPGAEVEIPFQSANSPTSAEVQTLLDHGFGPVEPQMGTSATIPTMNGFDFDIQKNLVNQNQLKECENRISEQLKTVVTSVCREIHELRADMALLKMELKDSASGGSSGNPRAQEQYVTKVINPLVNKLMGQLNPMISRGLNEFMGQIRAEIAGTENVVKMLQATVRDQVEQSQRATKTFEAQVAEMKRTMNARLEEQDKLSKQLMLHQTRMLMNPSPSRGMAGGAPMMPIHQLLNPGHHQGSSDMESLLSPAMKTQHEEYRRKRIAEEHAKKLLQIWTMLKEQDPATVRKGLIEALNMKDGHLLTKICEYFADRPEMLVNKALETDQTTLLSFLHQLALSDIKTDVWKLKFISLILPYLDLSSAVVKHNLAVFVSKLLAKVEEIVRNGKGDSSARLMICILKSYADQVKGA